MHDKFTRFIKGLLIAQHQLSATDTEAVSKSKAESELRRLCNDYRTALSCCRIYNNQAANNGSDLTEQESVRKQAIELLRQLLQERSHWESWKHEERCELKQTVLNTLDKASNAHDRVHLMSCLGILISEEQRKDDPWLSMIFKYIESKCTSSDEQQRLAGSEVFQALSATSPKCFVRQLKKYFELVSKVLINAEENNVLGTAMLANMMEGLAYLAPYGFKGHESDAGISKLTPLIVKVLRALIDAGEWDACTRAFKLIDTVTLHLPTQLFACNIELYISFLTQFARTEQIDVCLRARALQHVATFWAILQSTVPQDRQFANVLTTVLHAFTAEHVEEALLENYSFRLQLVSTPMFDAALTVYRGLVASYTTDKLFNKLVEQLQPELKDIEPQRRRAVFLCLMLLAEELNEPIGQKSFSKVLVLLQLGIDDQMSLVRDDAFKAVAVLTEHAQPTVWQFTAQLLPWFCQYLAQLVEALKAGAEEPSGTHRMFYALELHCQHGEQSVLRKNATELYQRLLELHKLDCSVTLSMLTLNAFAALSNSVGNELLEPHFDELMSILENHLINANKMAEGALRCQAMDTISAIASVINCNRFLPLAEPILNYALTLLQESIDDPDTRRAIFRLIGVLSGVINEQMPRVYRRIMNTLFASANGERVKQFDSNTTDRIAGGSEANILLFDKYDVYSEQEESIYALMHFAVNTSAAFLPHLKKAFHCVYSALDHAENDIRRAACEALTQFIHVQRQQLSEDTKSVFEMRHMLMPKMVRIVREVEHIELVTSALRCIKQIVQELGADALPDIDTADAVYMCIKDVLCLKVACLGSERKVRQADALFTIAGRLLPLFGAAMTPDRFAEYFEKMPRILYRSLKGSKVMQSADAQRVLFYETLSHCLAPLGQHCGNFVDTIGSAMLRGLSDKNSHARELACFGLGELMLYAKQRADGAIVNTLKVLNELIANEKDGGVQDMYCGAVARIMIVNYNQVPLDDVLNDVFRLLPLRKHQTENNIILRCFNTLYLVARHALQKFLDKLLAYLMHVLQKHLLADAEQQIAIDLMIAIRSKFPKVFDAFGYGKPEAYLYVKAMC